MSRAYWVDAGAINAYGGTDTTEQGGWAGGRRGPRGVHVLEECTGYMDSSWPVAGRQRARRLDTSPTDSSPTGQFVKRAVCRQDSSPTGQFADRKVC